MKEEFTLRKEKMYLLSRNEREEVYQTLKATSNSTSVLCRKEEWKEMYGIRL